MREREAVNLFEELQLDGVMEEQFHGTGAMVHKDVLIKCYRLSLQITHTRSQLWF